MNGIVTLPLAGEMVSSPVILPSSKPHQRTTALSEQLDTAVEKLTSARIRYDAIKEKVFAAIEPFLSDLPDDQDQWSQADRQFYHRIKSRFEISIGGDELKSAGEAHSDAYEQIDLLLNAIQELDPCDKSNLGLQARCTAIACSHYWRRPENEMDWDVQQAARLVEAVFRTAGLPTVRDYLGCNIPSL